jgi:Glycine-zipper domain
VGWSVFNRSLSFAFLGALGFVCGCCASPGPASPSLIAMPGRGKSFELFQRDEQYCQASAQHAIGNQSPGETANQSTARGAVVGTALGAVGGAALGSLSGNMGAGALLGGGAGLLAGSAIGAGNGDVAGGSLQARYDTVYAQCMTAKGNRIGAPSEPIYVAAPPPPYYWGPRYYFSYW